MFFLKSTPKIIDGSVLVAVGDGVEGIVYLSEVVGESLPLVLVNPGDTGHLGDDRGICVSVYASGLTGQMMRMWSLK